MLMSPLAWIVYVLSFLSVFVAAVTWPIMRKGAIAARRRQIRTELGEPRGYGHGYGQEASPG
jgi:hypothetical protein